MGETKPMISREANQLDSWVGLERHEYIIFLIILTY